MFEKIKKWRNIYLILLLVGNAIGLFLAFYQSENLLQEFSYYTVQSNLFVFGFFLYLLLKKRTTTRIQNIKGAITIAIMITFIVYHLMLAPTLTEKPDFWMNFFVHTYTPLMVLLDYFLFDPKGELSYKFVPYWLVVPIYYLVYANMYALLGGLFIYDESVSRYPYYFINPDKIGWGGVLFYVLGISVFVILLSYGFVFLDQQIVKEKTRA
ncbi:MAG: Pr6Pr family membrane protein [Candidatus Izemoplasmatales bacterium]